MSGIEEMKFVLHQHSGMMAIMARELNKLVKTSSKSSDGIQTAYIFPVVLPMMMDDQLIEMEQVLTTDPKAIPYLVSKRSTQ